jgi:hypothetical protein
MNQLINNSLAIITILATVCTLASCKKDGDQLTLQNGKSPAGLQASVNPLVITPDHDNDTVVKFNWQPADFGQQPAITYTLQLARPADTTTWTNAKAFTVSSNALSWSFTGKDLNNLLNSMGLTPGSVNTLALRIRADVNQYNGSTSTVAPVYSNTLIFSVTPYALDLYIPGDYQGWNPGSAPKLSPVAGRAGLYEAYENMPGAGPLYFKYTSAPDWNHINYGDGGNGTFTTDGLAGGLSVPTGGYYELTADLDKNTWTATKTSWGIIGDATPGGWNSDTQMSYDATNQVWTVTADMIKNGSFKFRANNAWAIDFGIDNQGNLVYADNPFLGYTAGLNNLSVAADGNYTITLDLHISGKYTYKLVKN